MSRKMLRNVEKRGVPTARNGPSPPPTPAGGPVAKPEMSTADRLGSSEGSSRAPAGEGREPIGCVERAMTHRSASRCGFAIWDPFPVQAPDKAPETCTWSTRSADRGSQVSALGVGLPSGTPFRCRHRIKHRKRAPGQRGLRVGANLLSRNLDGNQIAWKYRRCAGHANLLFRDGVKRQVGKCDCLLEFTTRPELSQSRARIWPQQHVPKRLKNSATRNSTARSQNRRLAICMA